jgi:hypothetical protein
MSNKPEARIAERAKERAEERKRQQRRRRTITAIVALAATGVIFLALYLVANAPSEAPIPEGALSRYEGLVVGTNDDGFPMLGRRNARVNVVAYAAFTEPQGYEFYRDIFPALLERVRADEISFAFAPVGVGVGRNPEGAARAALCAGEQGRFWPAFDTFFTWSNEFGTSAFNTNRLREGVEALGVQAGPFNDCFGQGRIGDLLVIARQSLTAPVTVRVNGAPVDVNLDAINEAIDAFGPFTPSGAATPEATPEVTPEATPEAAPEVTPEPTPEATPEVTPEAETTPDAAESTPEATAEGS